MRFTDSETLGKYNGGDVRETGLQQLLAASAMVVTLERIASSGFLPDADECAVRLLIVRACQAFKMPSIAERSNVIDLDSAVEALVRKEMERTP